MSEDKQKRLNLMRFWLFGTFVIVWAATLTFTYLWIAPIGASFMDVIMTALPVWVITAVLAVVWYFGYKWWLSRSAEKMPAPAAAMPESAPPPAPEPPSYSPPDQGGGEG